MKVSIIQSNIIWEDIQQNLDLFSKKILSVKEETDLIVLPEMFATGFTMQPDIYASFQDVQIKWLKEHAAHSNAVITGSVITRTEDMYFNSLIWMRPDGTYEQYNKRHLFSFAGEHEHYTAGNEHIITHINDWSIMPLICYDLRFPVWSRNKNTYDILLYVANWPHVRIDAWKKLLFARAIENLSYVIAVNRVGDDGNGIAHSGASCIIDPKGNMIADFDPFEEGVKTCEINLSELKAFREKFPAENDADDFQILYRTQVIKKRGCKNNLLLSLFFF